MKIALIDIKGDDNRSIKKNAAINIRNMMQLSNLIDAKYYYNTAMLNNEKFDIIIFGFGSISSEINKTSDFVKRSGVKKIFWLVGEYEQSMNPALFYSCEKTGLKFETIQNFDIKAKSFGSKCIKKNILNINLLISKPVNGLISKKYDCIYYSRWRPGRAKYLKEYLQQCIYFSTDNKNFKQHKHIGCNPKNIAKLSWIEGKETLNLFRYSLYIEDEYTHKVFNNLANRWYEAGFCNCVVFFDVNCWNTIRKSEIGYFEEQIKDYIVHDYDSLKSKIEYCNQNFEKHLAIQMSWRMSEPQLKNQLIQDIKSLITK
jgi:hypothetical protein